MIGQKLGHYRIVEKIGAGGMGVVYRARDERLERDVALKVLPAGTLADEAARKRFRKEALALSKLNHPNIATVHDFDTQDGVDFLVMEHVAGTTLAEKLKSGSLPEKEVAQLGRQIASALEEAHEQHVVHRDLKPGNIALTVKGQVKVLDFGLAKLVKPLSQATTLDSLSESRPFAGTLPYMSPEQTRGEPVDKRTDIWAFGCLLYELLTGWRAFTGRTRSDLTAAILEHEPDWESLPADTSASVRRLLRRCLRNDPRQRLHDIADARLELEEILSGAGIEDDKEAPRPPALWRRAAPWLLLPLAAVAVWMFRPAEAPRTLPTVRFTVPMPEKERLAGYYRPGFALSPDGSMLAFVSGTQEEAGYLQPPSNRRIFIRSLDDPEARPLPGTEDAFWPVFSPDGRWLAFGLFDGSNFLLRKVEVTGGNPVTLCECSAFHGLTWGSDDTIVFAGKAGGLKRVSAAGGEPETITELDASAGEVSHRTLIRADEIEIRDLSLSESYSGFTLTGSVKNLNGSYTLTGLTLSVKFYDCPVENNATSKQGTESRPAEEWVGCETIADEDVSFYALSVPPGQVRGFDEHIYVSDLPKIKGSFLWFFEISATKGRE